MKHKKPIIIAALAAAITITALTSSQAQAKNRQSDETTIEDVCTSDSDYVKIQGYLYYDPHTKIVLMKHATYGWNYVYVPYTAPDGFPYKYNADTQTFYTITSEKEAAEQTATPL